MAPLILSREDFKRVFESLIQEYEVFGPTIKNGLGAYSDTDICVYDRLNSFEQLEFRKRTYFSAKEMAFPVSERLFDITTDGFKESGTASCKKIVFARSCDIEGFDRLDKIFLETGLFVDFYYKRLRDTISFFLIECLDGFEGCFCQSTDSDKTTGYAVSIRESQNKFLVKIKEESFMIWFDFLNNKEADELDEAGEELQQDCVDIPLLTRNKFEDPLWDEYAKRCAGCGRCNVVCPTCSCFSIYDSRDEKGEYRKRIWAGCQIDGFGKISSGHEYRTDKGQRMRYKLFHKFHSFKERFGQYMCVGCGRCIEACPEYIDIRTSLEKLNNGEPIQANCCQDYPDTSRNQDRKDFCNRV